MPRSTTRRAVPGGMIRGITATIVPGAGGRQ
jgi:hypothetical protein